MELNSILTLEEVAQYLRVSVRTVYDWAQKGEIPAGKLGTSWRFKREEIEHWVDERLLRSNAPLVPPSIDIQNIFSPSRMILTQSFTKDEVLHSLISLLCKSKEIKNSTELENEIFYREKLMSTAIGLGVAVPHVRLGSVSNIVAAAMVSTKDIIDYETIDEKPVRIIVMIAAGRKQHAEYLRLLAYIATLFKQEQFRNRFITAKTPQELYKLIIQEN